ncbi:putative pantothenate transporter [Aspergillus nomiae NRRL 13137]|uniref:Putative pantothenate transporter n=1 Tax=Aspergillus nomiae NRRL (strain ATCC 15546 / NRRL 13137 / CBS 260.88 / M93) TaxID=1509407 RepID=A0A0L1JEX6_ASPN3|nr:putative pantothenate transporter [Aspergillus nomiae NRRL 13137]KNG90374.1 putative pantothenate transporter [Aspergillus nomiae NRRL 13137]
MDIPKAPCADIKDEERRVGEVVNITAACSPEEEKAVLRKIDMVILPFLCFVFFLQYLDKQSLSYAGVFGLMEDLNLTNAQYSWCSSIFYVGQLVSEYPFIYLMSRLPLTKFVGVTVIVWGGMCMCLAAPKTYSGFAAVRFLLGFSEGAVSPAFVTITSIWYCQKEHTTRTALWISMNGMAQVIGCLLMSLLLSAHAERAQRRMVSHAREKEVLRQRMAHDHEGGDKTSFSISQLKETLIDPKAWLVFWFGVLVTMQSPVLTFASLVIESLGYSKLDTMLYTAPSGAVQMALLWIGVALASILPRQRTLVALMLIIPPLVGTVFLLKLDLSAEWGMIAMSWLSSCITASMSILLSLSASNVKGNTKRAIVNTMFFIGYCAGCIGSPQLWTHRPRYNEGVITSIVTWCLLFVAVIIYRLLCMQDNKKREANACTDIDPSGGDMLEENGLQAADVTDKNDPSFRYAL